MTGTVYDLSTTAADNDDALLAVGVDWRENQTPGSVNNSARAMLAAWRAFLTMSLGAVATGGSSNAYTYTSPGSFTLSAYVTGVRVTFNANHSNSGAATLNVDGLGAKSITKNGTTAVATGDIVSGRVYEVVYDGTQFQLMGERNVGVYQPLDATLSALAALAVSADQYIYATGSDTFSLATVTSFARTVLDDTTAGAARTTLGAYGSGDVVAVGDGTPAVPGVNFASDPDNGLERSASNNWSLVSAGSRRLTVRSNGQIGHVGLGSASTPDYTFNSDLDTGFRSAGTDSAAITCGGTDRLTVSSAGIATTGVLELGGATDATLARSGAGLVSVEGVDLVGVSLTQTLTNKTLTSPTINGGTIQSRVQASSETTGTLTSASANKAVTCTGGITLPNSVFTANDAILFDPGASSRTFTRGSGIAMYVNGADSASATLAANKLGSAYWRDASTVILSGAFS